MGYEGKGFSIYAIVLLALATLFFPIQQGYGVLSLSPELSNDEEMELYKLEQLIKAEQARDKVFLREQKNPYSDTESYVTKYNSAILRLPTTDIQASSSTQLSAFSRESTNTSFSTEDAFETSDDTTPLSENKEDDTLDRTNKNFQLIKDEQISIAEKKYDEILGGKIISNSPNYEQVDKKSVHEFKIDDHTNSINRSSDDFQNYKLLQISIVEDFRDNNWKKSISQKEYQNPYQKDDPISMLTIEEHENLEQIKPKRQSEKFKNLIAEQITLAENTRNEMPHFGVSDSFNPYLDENVDESVETSNRNATNGDGTPPALLFDELEINIIFRESDGFKTAKAFEIEIAQDTLNEMLLMSNSKETDEESISLDIEIKKPNDIERNDQGFEFFKNKQIDVAEQKLMEILGQKKIHNFNH